MVGVLGHDQAQVLSAIPCSPAVDVLAWGRGYVARWGWSPDMGIFSLGTLEPLERGCGDVYPEAIGAVRRGGVALNRHDLGLQQGRTEALPVTQLTD